MTRTTDLNRPTWYRATTRPRYQRLLDLVQRLEVVDGEHVIAVGIRSNPEHLLAEQPGCCTDADREHPDAGVVNL